MAKKPVSSGKAVRDREVREKVRILIKKWASFGLTWDQIFTLLPDDQKISVRTMRERYGDDFANGIAMANLKVVESLYGKAIGRYKAMNGVPDTTAAIFWLKARMNWTDRPRLGIGSPDTQNRDPTAPELEESRVQVYAPDNGRLQTQEEQPEPVVTEEPEEEQPEVTSD